MPDTPLHLHSVTHTETGHPFPLGASPDPEGCNFAVASPGARQVFLCLFDADEKETDRIPLPHRTGSVWHTWLAGIQPGSLYAFRAEGPWDPEAGHYFNPDKLLLDPYAHDLTRPARYSPVLNTLENPDAFPDDLSASPGDSADALPKCRVIDQTAFDWREDRPPRTPWQRTIVYETHVRGLTIQHPDVPEADRGTYLGMAHPAIIDHLTSLGITAVQLMPIQAQMPEPHLEPRGLTNYWGYNSIAWFAPEPRYAQTDAVNELKHLVYSLHAAGMEVILDVVYNHTAEADATGSTVSLKGLSAADSYCLGASGLNFTNHTGCGNTLDMDSELSLALVMDSLRHWVCHYHIDGFRFDLAATLGRENDRFNPRATFFRAVAQDPVLSRVKLIAEPWDIGPDGYQLGQFPETWFECNDRFRDTVRGFWRGDTGLLPDFCTRLMGSRDRLQKGERALSTSLNYVTYHDGFTLEDLVSYERRHNEENGENNEDGHGHNLSANHGVEGPTDDPEIRAVRDRQKRNLLATLFLSQGPAHLLGGDELGRTQMGNNNAYCQDNAVSWYDWQHADPALHKFVAYLIRLQQGSPLFHDLTFSDQELADGPAHSDRVHWLNCAGRPMSIADWHEPEARSVGLLLSRRADPGGSTDSPEPSDQSENYLWLIHAGTDEQTFTLPDCEPARWVIVLDTGQSDGIPPDNRILNDVPEVRLGARSLMLLRAA